MPADSRNVDENEEDTQNPVQLVQNTLAELDPTAMCTGFVAVIEWIEEDGSPSLSMVHSPMPQWHLTGMLDHAQKYHDIPVMVLGHGEDAVEEWEDEDGL